MKKNICFLILSITLILAACGNKSNADSDKGDQKEYVIKYAHNQKVDSPQDKGANLFKEKIEELTDGQIKVEIYPSNQLGEQRELVEQVQSGQIEITQQSLSNLSNFAPVLTFNDLPFLYPTEDILWKSLNGKVGDIYNNALNEVSMVNLGYMSGGAKQYSANKPINTLADFNGITMRAQPAPIVIETMKALGANPTPIEFSELYNSLQQGVVDGQENPFETVVNFNLFEVQDYITVTSHSYMIYANVMNKDFWNSLSEDLQGKVQEAMRFASEEQIKILQENEKEYRKVISGTDMKIIEPTEDAIKEMKQSTKGVYDKFGNELGKDILNEITTAIEEYGK